MLKIWCGAHRADLAFSSVSSSVSEVNTIIKDASALSTFFHTSAVRTKALQQIGERNGFVVKRLPSYFEVRWTEFTYRLLFNILSSWKAIVSYLQTSDDSAAKGHLRNWTDLCKLKTVCLVADLLMVFSRFQKSPQDNAINVFDMESKVTSVKKRISEFKASSLLGGWEECLEKDLSVKNKFHGIQLIGRQRRNERHHALVSDRRDFKAIRNETITSLSNFIEQRYKSEQGSLSKLKPLKKLKENIMDQELKECHQSIITDKSLAEFGLQYKEAASIPELNTAENPTDLLTLLLRSSKSGNNMDVLITALARVIVGKPHSADVERLIKSYNVVKTIERSSISSETLRSYLYIRHNIPVVYEFDPCTTSRVSVDSGERTEKRYSC